MDSSIPINKIGSKFFQNIFDSVSSPASNNFGDRKMISNGVLKGVDFEKIKIEQDAADAVHVDSASVPSTIRHGSYSCIIISNQKTTNRLNIIFEK